MRRCACSPGPATPSGRTGRCTTCVTRPLTGFQPGRPAARGAEDPRHKNIDTTIGYKAVYPAEAIEAHRAFIARHRATRPSEEYRTPTDEEWDAFLALPIREAEGIRGHLRPRVRDPLRP